MDTSVLDAGGFGGRSDWWDSLVVGGENRFFWFPVVDGGSGVGGVGEYFLS